MASRNRRSKHSLLGATSFQIMVLLVPVLFGLMWFAVDLGRLYMIRAELKTAANSMALAAAGQLIGTDQATTDATAAAARARADVGGFANKYDFGGVLVGQGTNNLASTVEDPQYFDTATDAIGTGDSGGGSTSTGGSTAKVAKVTVTSDAPLLFFRWLAQGVEGKTSISVDAVAGISAPLCTACGTQVVAVSAVDSTDDTDFGFTAATRYTFAYQCTVNNGQNGQAPQPLAGSSSRINYILINRLNDAADTFADESTQAFRAAAGGLPGSSTEALACVSVNAVETIWATALPPNCGQPMPAVVNATLCGLDVRLEGGVPTGCDAIADISTAANGYIPDTDTTDNDDYVSYAGNGRRVLTVAIVDSLSDTSAMTVLGFRQFLLQPQANAVNLNVTDLNARFAATYIGSPMPLKQGRFSGCSITSGPGKVVLHR